MKLNRTAAWNQDFRKRLLRWYRANQRDLPWRHSSDPYAIWVSETMLQQTQVATVIDYYHRFLTRFPTIQTLASADEQDVLELWSGLGYYRRARQLHAAAKEIVARFSGSFPTDLEEIQSLPGIGRYTAGAVASFAFDQRAPILEANTIRLFSRLIGLRELPQQTASQKRLWDFAEAILPNRSSGSGQVNQACMELGSLVCTPKNPRCMQCPVHSLCSAHQLGMENEIPLLRPKTPATEIVHFSVLITDEMGRVLLRQNPSGQWWEGLWDLPWTEGEKAFSKTMFDKHGASSPEVLEVVRSQMKRSIDLDCEPLRLHSKLRHAVTRYKVDYFSFEATLCANDLPRGANWNWHKPPFELPITSRLKRLRFPVASS